jgi:hypothetical protein
MVQKNRGRIRPDARDADDDVEIIGAEIELNEAQGVDETNDHKRIKRAVANYWNRIQHVYTFIAESYAEYGTAGGVRELSAEEQGTHHKNTKDLKYTGLNVAIIMAFLASKKQKKRHHASEPRKCEEVQRCYFIRRREGQRASS